MLATPTRSFRPARLPRTALYHSSRSLQQEAPTPKTPTTPLNDRPSIAPKPNIDIKHIRLNPELYAQNCRDRNYQAAAAYPARINGLFAQWQAKQHEGRGLRERANLLRRQIANPATSRDGVCEVWDGEGEGLHFGGEAVFGSFDGAEVGFYSAGFFKELFFC